MDGNNWNVWSTQFLIGVESKSKEKFLTVEEIEHDEAVEKAKHQ